MNKIKNIKNGRVHFVDTNKENRGALCKSVKHIDSNFVVVGDDTKVTCKRCIASHAELPKDEIVEIPTPESDIVISVDDGDIDYGIKFSIDKTSESDRVKFSLDGYVKKTGRNKTAVSDIANLIYARLMRTLGIDQ